MIKGSQSNELSFKTHASIFILRKREVAMAG